MNDYQRIERAIAWIEEHWREQPSVEAMAGAIGLSSSRFHRLFRRWAGITPKRLVEFLTATHARKQLIAQTPLLDTALDSGLSGPGRLHDLMVTVDGATPGQIARNGQGLDLVWGLHEGPFGHCLIAESPRGVCLLDFVAEDSRLQVAAKIAQRWPQAALTEAPERTRATFDRILASLRGEATPPKAAVLGSNFQIRVWEALLRIPPGRMISYGELASAIGAPGASRAVGTAVGANPVPLLIPCHRVLRQTGDFGQYSGGRLRKRAILLWEQAEAPSS
ncbi:methylated-DNA--[protein]-cysteine S-methyltransferase [Wenzhouxiangella marina]|uniref:methylated-DNA--[protein]-cysteine S-methyltransferase n=1 Tax=Wenzhouxiangella marina TaxID=1579979 RepID=A0A0K0XSS2_9GAMM|nr:bifunctional helix-turn-helix domain-containing protein/methylated-DNA--[protein]-cysteine S-methyltransferase [Wenzhouxiangella marina]AKS40695.1 6-O-methylguanine DNA methyltransferase [Wenzhouxiangella marina]MBB6088465.1 AraC family transcriptional regulator of adaptative response/methylated-DNA-[protein]-cysteine methyltransferase [Wenzhouxiangella marina]